MRAAAAAAGACKVDAKDLLGVRRRRRACEVREVEAEGLRGARELDMKSLPHDREVETKSWLDAKSLVAFDLVRARRIRE